MIPPKEQWCIQIDVTNKCPRGCANCTHLCDAAPKRWEMSPSEFTKACEALADFPKHSPPAAKRADKLKVVGIIGGEPLAHSSFFELCLIMIDKIPDRMNRGLWIGKSIRDASRGMWLSANFGFINDNDHSENVVHQPVLVAVEDILPEEQSKEVINKCWLQEKWSSSIVPRGFYFCEVAGSLAMLFGDGPDGLPVEPGCWKRPLEDFQEQIDFFCRRCGICMGLPARPDTDKASDVSPSNLQRLKAIGSPLAKEGRHCLRGPEFFTGKIDRKSGASDSYRKGWRPRGYAG